MDSNTHSASQLAGQRARPPTGPSAGEPAGPPDDLTFLTAAIRP
jgi:hypothetical protein